MDYIIDQKKRLENRRKYFPKFTQENEKSRPLCLLHLVLQQENIQEGWLFFEHNVALSDYTDVNRAVRLFCVAVTGKLTSTNRTYYHILTSTTAAIIHHWFSGLRQIHGVALSPCSSVPSSRTYVYTLVFTFNFVY